MAYLPHKSSTGYFGRWNSHQHPFVALDPEETDDVFIGHHDGHHVLSRDNLLPHGFQVRHLLDVPISIQMPLCRKDFVFFVHEDELMPRRAVSGALDLGTQMGVVTIVEILKGTIIPRQQDWGCLPCKSSNAYSAGAVVKH